MLRVDLYLVLILSTTFIHETVNQLFDIKVKENIPENIFVSDLNLFDNHGSDSYKPKLFTLISSANSKINTLFQLRTDGKLYTSKLIDRELLCSQIEECCHNKDICTISILVAVSSSSMVSPRTFECRLQIEDENDNAPRFPQNKITIPIKESSPVGSLFALPLATDLDSEKFSIRQYILVEEPTFPPTFSLEQVRPSTNLNLQIIQRLDREKKSSYELTILAIDGGSTPLTGKLLIEIKVVDVNDNPPRLLRNNYVITQKESVFVTQPLLTIEAKDDDENENAEMFFKIVNENPFQNDVNKYFRVEHGSGKVFLNQPLDYEKHEKFRFFVEVSNKIGEVETATATVLVNVENLNDEKPEISINYLNMNKINADILENDIRTKFVALATVSDKDKGVGGQVICKLINFDDTFEIQIKDLSRFPNQYNIQTKVSLDREKVAFYKLIMECEDKGYPVLKTKKEINVIVKDVNDNLPSINVDKNISVKENSPRRTTVTKIQAVDDDEGENGELLFSISDSEEQTLRLLEINSGSGELQTKEIIDREKDAESLKILHVVLTVTDKGKPPLSRIKAFTVTIEDENDNPPQFPSELIQFSVTENQEPRFTLGEIPITDKDDESQLRVTMAPSADHNLNPFVLFKHENRFYLNTTRSLDWEKEKSFSLKVIASDGYGYKSHTVTAEIAVTVRDENDNVPIIIFPTQKNFTIPRLSFLEKIGFTVLTVSAIDKDSPETNNGKLCYHIFGNKDLFTIDSNTGAIKTSRQMSRLDMGRFEVKVVVRDYGTPMKESFINLFIEVDDSKPQLYNESHKDSDESVISQSHSYMWTKEGFLVISLIVLLLFLLICVFMILYMRHIKGLFPVLPDLFLSCRKGSNRKCDKSAACGKSSLHIPFDNNQRSSPLDFQQCNLIHQEKCLPPYYLNKYDSSANNATVSDDHHMPASTYRQYETMKYQQYTGTNPTVNVGQNTCAYNYDKLFYAPLTMHGEATIQFSGKNPASNNLYDSRSQTIASSVKHNLPIFQRIVNNIESSPLLSPRLVKENTNDHFESDLNVCKCDDNEEAAAIADRSVLNTPNLRSQFRPSEKVDTYAITYPVEQSTFV